MKKILLSLALMASLVAGAQNEPTLKPGHKAPCVCAPDTLGKMHCTRRLAKGRYVILDFWASWCGDCRREIPALKKLYAQYPDNGERVWVSVSFDHKKADWMQLLRKEQFPWLQLSNGKPWKENPIARKWDLHWIPTFFIIDPQGRIAASAITAEELGKRLQEIGQNDQ